jgi:hypothetical protein
MKKLARFLYGNGACMSVTLPNITSGWLDAIDQEKLGELHEIFYDDDATAN